MPYAAQDKSGPIKLILADIDGCILPRRRHQIIDLSVIDQIRQHNQLSRENPTVPPVTLCSGRPQPYVELMMKLIGGYIPALFEWNPILLPLLGERNNELQYKQLS